MQLRFKPPLLRSVDNSQRLGQQVARFGWVSSLSANVCQQAQKKGYLVDDAQTFLGR
jgi:hypothetical protein